MAESGSWKTLVDGDGSEGIVLAVDFDTTGRPEARFSDLVANLGAGLTVWETVPPAHGTEHARSGKGYIDYWAARLEEERPPVRALLGFCAGAVYAAALAERIAGWQEGEPRLIVFDPEISVSQTLMWQYHKVVGFMSSVISEADVAAAREAGLKVLEACPEIGALRDGLIRLIREIGEPAFTRVGLDATRREELFTVFESFLSYLAAASELDPVDRWRRAVAFSSASPLSGLRAMRSSGVGEGITVAREVEMDVEHGSMLAHRELAVAVEGLLRG